MPRGKHQDTNSRQTLTKASVQAESVPPMKPPSVAQMDHTHGEENTFEKNCAPESVDYFDDIGFPKTNVALVVEHKKIHVNKAVLSQHSPVFNAMFSGNYKERNAKEIKLENKKAVDFVEFLRCFYPNMKHAITELNVLQVLPLAHEYQSPLVPDCEEFMISMCEQGKGLTVTSLLDYIIAAEKYKLETFLDTAVEFCSHVDFDHLNGNLKESIAIRPVDIFIIGMRPKTFLQNF